MISYEHFVSILRIHDYNIATDFFVLLLGTFHLLSERGMGRNFQKLEFFLANTLLGPTRPWA